MAVGQLAGGRPQLLIEIPPYLKRVAKLPCEMLMFANRVTFCQSLMVSVGVSKLGCSHLIFVDPGVTINGCYYRDASESTVVTCHTADVWRLRVITSQCTGAQGTRDNQAAATGDARIHLT